jgi:nitrogen fixation protein NifU and related proteins
VTTPLYGGVILERFRHPRHFGELPGADAVHEDVNPLCGDRLRVEVRFGADREVEAVRFQGDACAIATASADLLAELAEGRPLADVLRLERDALLTALDAPIRASRLGCVSLPLAVLRGALGGGAEQIARARGRQAAAVRSAPPGVTGERP